MLGNVYGYCEVQEEVMLLSDNVFLLKMFCFRGKKSEIIYIKMLTIVIPKCCNGKRGLISYLGFAVLANFSSTGR